MFLYGDIGHYDCITICIFGEMITRLISDSSHYTLSFIKYLSLMKTVINSKMYMWINLWITVYKSRVSKGNGYPK
jgi:hypothetical protein